MLDAVRGGGSAGHLWQEGTDYTRNQRGAISPGQEQHGVQPGHICAFQQPG